MKFEPELLSCSAHLRRRDATEFDNIASHTSVQPMVDATIADWWLCGAFADVAGDCDCCKMLQVDPNCRGGGTSQRC